MTGKRSILVVSLVAAVVLAGADMAVSVAARARRRKTTDLLGDGEGSVTRLHDVNVTVAKLDMPAPVHSKFSSRFVFDDILNETLKELHQQERLDLIVGGTGSEFEKRYLEQSGRKLSVFEGERTTLAEVT